MNLDMTQGPVMKSMLRFAVPMILGNLLQQCYNITDTLIVGKFLGPDALAAVGSSFTLMTFLTSILLGLCMGSGTLFSIRFGEKDEKGLKESICCSFLMILLFTVILNGLAFLFLRQIQLFLNVPEEIWKEMRSYLAIIFCGIFAIFLYNYFAALLRATGNSIVPLIFLALSAILNIALDFFLIIGLHGGVKGAAAATVASQYISGIGIAIYYSFRASTAAHSGNAGSLDSPYLKIERKDCRIRWRCIREIASFSILTCVQQSVMNLGILFVQGIVNSFGAAVMAAFAAGVKIDAFAYMPVQDFGNAFSTFIAQNYGARKKERIQSGLRGAFLASLIFCIIASTIIWLFARPLMLLFVNAEETAIIAEGVRYLHIEGAFYCGIGCLFLLYGLYRALGKPGMSVILTILSLGTRVVLAYFLSAIPEIGVIGIWWAVPIGWFLADGVGLVYYIAKAKQTYGEI